MNARFRLRCSELLGGVLLLSAAILDAAEPAAPRNVRATETSPAHIRVEWDDVAADELGYRVWRRRIAGQEEGVPAPPAAARWHLVGETAAGRSHFDDGGMDERTLYEHKVAAFHGGGESEAVTGPVARTPAMQPHLTAVTIVPPGTFRAHSPSAIARGDGRLLLAYVADSGGGRRSWTGSSLWLQSSGDGGRTWSPRRQLQHGVDAIAFAKPALVRLPDGGLGMSYSRFTLDAKAQPATRQRFFIRSQDSGATWSAPVLISDSSSNNDTLIVGDQGRLLQALNDGSESRARIVSSDDLGSTWRVLSQVGARKAAQPTGESAMVHAGGGRLVLLSRQESPFYCLNFSADNGATWDGPHTLWLGGGDNPPKIARLPGSDVLVAVVHSWTGGTRQKDRRQLASLISADGGRTWDNFRLIGFAPAGDDGFLQHSLGFDGDTALIFYGGGSRNDTQDGKDLRMLRLHRDFFTSRTPWPYDWRGQPIAAKGNGG